MGPIKVQRKIIRRSKEIWIIKKGNERFVRKIDKRARWGKGKADFRKVPDWKIDERVYERKRNTRWSLDEKNGGLASCLASRSQETERWVL